MKLYAYGDSWTWGAGLDDRTQSWPHELGKLLNVDVVNRGIPGSNNRNISYSIVRDHYNNLLHDNLVIVMWTTPFRLGTPAGKDTTADNNFLLSTIAYEEGFDIEIFNKHLTTAETLSSIHPAMDVLKNNKYVFTSAFHDYTNTDDELADHKHLLQISEHWAYPQGMHKTIYKTKNYHGGHPDAQKHQQIAELLYKHLN